MATNFQVNLQIGAGTYFYQTFFITNPDFSPVDLTDCLVFGAIAKHSTAIDATNPDDGTNTAAIPFTAGVVDALAGQYYIEMTVEDTLKLEEGKYVYNVVIQTPEPDRHILEATGGLAFVSNAFGLVRNLETDK